MNMDNLKYLILVPLYLLTACAPPKTNFESPIVQDSPATKQIEPANHAGNTDKTTSKTISVEQRKAETKTVSSWEIRGALAAKNKAKGWSASMNWLQNGPSSYQIRLMGPLGAGTVIITKKGGTITFQDGPKKIISNNADELLLQQTGIRLPVNNLYYWVRGLPAPGKIIAEHRDQNNHLVQLKQSGYAIDFAKYTTVKGADLPGVVRLEGNGVMVKVIIKSWSV